MKRILFVDDEQNILDGLRNLLWKYRRETDMTFALGGEAALDELAKTPFDAIVSDMRMPGMDGATLLSKVKDDYPDMVRVVLSGHAEQETIFRALPVAHQFLGKPCQADRLFNLIERVCRLSALLNDHSLRRAVGHIEKLPSLPTTYHELTLAMSRPDVSARTIADIVQQDPAMCAKLLQLVNAACFGPAKSVTRIDQAVVYLGMELIRNLALSVNVFTALEQTSCCTVRFKALQEHSLLTARVASRLLPGAQLAQEAFTVGLLHDIGEIVLELCFPGLMQEEGDSCSQPVDQTEAEMFGTTHGEIGAYLLGLWGLPYRIVEAVAYHHNPAAAGETTFDLVSAVSVADALVAEASGNRAALTEIDMDRLNGGAASRLGEWKAIAEEEVQAWRTRN